MFSVSIPSRHDEIVESSHLPPSVLPFAPSGITSILGHTHQIARSQTLIRNPRRIPNRLLQTRHRSVVESFSLLIDRCLPKNYN
ncbi:hypothetical protein L1887_23912 [Cichorium endivia]|nr:hypothetical protein L1887_23912 [Cichorium endivia]